MEIKNYEDDPKACEIEVHHLHNQDGKKIDYKKKKTVYLTELQKQDIRLAFGESRLLIDSQVHNGTRFLPIRLDRAMIVDVDLNVYKIIKRGYTPENYQSYYKLKVPCIRKFICPHHHKKSPQVRFADGVLYCHRCNRVLNKEFENAPEEVEAIT